MSGLARPSIGYALLAVAATKPRSPTANKTPPHITSAGDPVWAAVIPKRAGVMP
jgi:hypothetical protein